MTRRRIRTGGQGAAFALLLLALLLRTVVPAGWMPAATGGFNITLCSGMGPGAARMGHDAPMHKDGPQPDHPCAFAGLGAALVAPAAIGVVATFTPVVAVVAGRWSRSVAIGQGLSAPPPPSTGPPTSL